MNQSDIEDVTGRNADNQKKAKNIAAERLRSFIERIERLQEEKRALAEDIKCVKAEAKSAGFDIAAINQILKERHKEPAEVEDLLSLLEVYRAALGMLDGQPLSEWARKRFDPPPAPAAEPEEPPADAPKKGADDTNGKADADGGEAAAPAEMAHKAPTDEDIEAARAQGGEDQRAGAKITANPWPFNDLRRAAWDEGWCAAAGTDGMDIPDAWRRRSKKSEGEK